jgi:putative sugar O-methyltransferase
MRSAPEIVRPSAYWETLNELNLKQLEEEGLTSFKRTVNRNYFQFFPSDPRSEQFRAMLRWWLRHPERRVLSARLSDPSSFPELLWRVPLARRAKIVGYAFYVAALWEYTRRHETLGLVERLEEPELGRPISVEHRGRRISEDLCNSALELTSIREGLERDGAEPGLVIELGGGYGRVAWAYLEAFPGARYVLVDIPPALAIAEGYLTTLFPERRAFRFRHFDSHEEVREELDRAQIAFLTPNQLELVPPLEAGLFVNISSLHEMRPAQIAHYLGQVGIHCRGHFYTKQWLRSINKYDELVIRREDYPIPPEWTTVFDRRHPVQTRFFEAMYRVESG